MDEPIYRHSDIGDGRQGRTMVAEMFKAGEKDVFYSDDRSEWRRWLEDHFETEDEIWFAFPVKDSGIRGIEYNDAVEEALCFGWIDSTAGHFDERFHIRRFTPRRKGSTYSRPNIERLIMMDSKGLIHPKVRPQVAEMIQREYVYPEDILKELKEDDEVWRNFMSFSDPYKRIRVAYIDAARHRPEEFRKRLDSFKSMTKRNRIITGYGGIDKYY